MSDHNYSRPIVGEKKCYHGDCEDYAKWGISSSSKQKNPDGSPLTLFSCNQHQSELTSMMRIVGTQYTLFPINNSDTTSHWNKIQNSSTPSKLAYEKKFEKPPMLLQIIIHTILIIVGAAISPFVLIYFGSKWISGWRPNTKDN